MALGLPQFIPLFGPLGVSGLTVAAVVGLLAGGVLVALRVRPDLPALAPDLADAAWAVLLGALVGARLGNQFGGVDLRWDAPSSWLTVTGTSLSFTGGVAGAAAGAWIGLRRLPGERRWELLDALAPGAALATAIGWLGLPAPGRFGGPLLPGALAQPVHVYALAGFAALAALLAWQWPRRGHPGQNAATFVVLASAFRVVLGFAEQATPLLGPWSLTQLGDGIGALAGLGLAIRLAPAGRAALRRGAGLAFLVPALAAVFLTAAAGRGGTGLTVAAGPAVGRPAPTFSLPASATGAATAGAPIALGTLRGSPVVINFWATWCPECRAELPALRRFHAVEGTAVALIGIDVREPSAVVALFAGPHGMDWPLLLDESGDVTSAYGVYYLPTTFFLDGNGVIRRIATGPLTFGQLRAGAGAGEAA